MAQTDQTPQTNPFGDEQPKIVHLEKNESHYEYCRMQMHEINRVHQRTFLCNMILCMIVCLLAVFKVYIGGFSVLSTPFIGSDDPGAILTGGIFQILFALLDIVLGYLAWANFHSLNIILAAWYSIVTVIGIFKLDYLTAIIGIVGLFFYIFAIQAMRKEGALSTMDGYPDFHETFSIDKSDFVIQTLLAHKDERSAFGKKKPIFSEQYSLRKKKSTHIQEDTGSASEALAEELQRTLADAKASKANPAAETKQLAAAPASQEDISSSNADAAAETVPDSIPDILSQQQPQQPKQSHRKKKRSRHNRSHKGGTST